MPDIWMDVDTALAEVPINTMPLIDDTDFKSREESVTYNQAGLDLVWNFVTTGGAFTQTAVTPTESAGDYDWTNQGNGMYTIEVPASGGASINNDAEGFGWFTGFATGILPWRGPTIGFRAAGLNNALIDSAYSATRGLGGTALPDAAADAAGGLVVSDAGGLDADAMAASVTAIEVDTGTTLDGKIDTIDGIVDAILVDTGTTLPATLSTIDGKIDTVDGVVDAILLDTAEIGAAGAGLTEAGGTGDHLTALATAAALSTVDSNVDAILVDTGTTLPATLSTIDGKIDTIDGVVDAILLDTAEIGAAGAGLTAVPWNAAWDAEVQSEVADALNAYDPPTKAELDSGFAALNDLSAAAVNAEVDTAIETYHLDHLFAATYDPASKPGAADALLNEMVEDDGGVSRFTVNALEQAPTGGSAPTVEEIADAVLDEALSGHTSAGTLGKAVADIEADTNELQSDDIPGTLATIDGKIDTVDGVVDAILLDTAEIGAAGAGLTEAGGTGDHLTALATAAALSTVDGNVDAILVDTGTTLPATLSTIDGKIDTVDGVVDAIKLVIDALPDAGALTSIAQEATLGTPADTDLATDIANLVDQLFTAAQAEPTGVPAADLAPMLKLATLYKMARNKLTQTATELKFHNNAGAAEIKKVLSDDGTTYTEGEVTSV